MHRTLPVILTLMIALLLLLIPVTSSQSNLTIVVTTPSLVGDVERIVSDCGDVVFSLVPQGVDIHEYQLTPSDRELLSKADLIISTGHTSFELKIRELIREGELNAILLDILEIPGLKIRVNPVTGQLNYHMPVKDPVNYLLFMSNLTRTLSEINPSKANCYYSNYFKVLDELYKSILVHRDEYSGLVIVDTPHAQYYVEWTGLRVAWILKYEEEVPITMESLEKTSELLSSGLVRAVFITEGFQGGDFLVEEAKKHGVIVITVPHPSSNVSVLNGLYSVVDQLRRLVPKVIESTSSIGAERGEYSNLLYYSLTFTLGVIIGVSLVELYKRWRIWRLK
jgi:zinc/manganese transport system substrate-binding protein